MCFQVTVYNNTGAAVPSLEIIAESRKISRTIVKSRAEKHDTSVRAHSQICQFDKFDKFDKLFTKCTRLCASYTYVVNTVNLILAHNHGEGQNNPNKPFESTQVVTISKFFQTMVKV